MHFKSENELDGALSTIAVSDYEDIVERAEQARARNELAPPDVASCIKGELEKNRFIRMLPILPTSDPKARLLKLLGTGKGTYGLPPPVRKALADHIWGDEAYVGLMVCSLHSFLSLFPKEFDTFKDALTCLDPWIVREACIKLFLGIGCAKGFAGIRAQLLWSLKALFHGDSCISLICSLHGTLSFDASIADIFRVVESKDPSLLSLLSTVLQSSPEHAETSRYKALFGRPTFSWCQEEFQAYRLFSRNFRIENAMSDADRHLLLKSLKVEGLLKSIPRYALWTWPSILTDPEIQALVKWANGKCDICTLAFHAAVTLYSLDNDPDALKKYFRSSPKRMGLLQFSEIILHVAYAGNLPDHKLIALLKLFAPQRLADYGAPSKDDARVLAANDMPLLADLVPGNFSGMLNSGDFSGWVERCLDRPETCCLPRLDPGQRDQATRNMLKKVGNDLQMADFLLHRTPDQIKVFLWTDCDAVAEHLGRGIKEEELIRAFLHCLNYFGFESCEEAARAARRVHRWLLSSGPV